MFAYLKKLTGLLVILVPVGCHDKPPGNAAIQLADGHGIVPGDIAKISAEYKDLKLMTPEPVFVNPELAMLCVGASKAMADSAKVDHGPHANCSVNVFMNDRAAKAFNQKSAYPVDAIIVKEKQMLGYRTEGHGKWNGAGDGVGGMIKREEGYDPSNGDWEYFYFDTIDNIESGRMSNCIECHARAKDTDYVFGSWSGIATNDDNSGAGY